MVEVTPPPQSKIYLHLGCGPQEHPAYTNIDIFEAPHVHFVQHVDKLPQFETDSVEGIYSSHCLEHFGRFEVPVVLQEWHRVLKQGGLLTLSVPDFDSLVTAYTRSNSDVNQIIFPLMGGQANDFDFHKTVFTRASLTSLLFAAGFADIRTWEPDETALLTFQDWSRFPLPCADGSTVPVSLNLQGTKGRSI